MPKVVVSLAAIEQQIAQIEEIMTTNSTITTLEKLADNALMLQVKQGNTDQMGLLYRRHSRPLFGFFYRLTNDGNMSEDLVHNVFMRMLKYKHTFTGDGKFTTWLYHLARNVHNDYLKKHLRRGNADSLENWAHKLADKTSWEETQDHADDLLYLQKALQHLPSEKREMLILHRYQGLKYAEIGAMYGISESAAKVRVFRILKELKNIYEKLNAPQ